MRCREGKKLGDDRSHRENWGVLTGPYSKKIKIKELFHSKWDTKHQGTSLSQKNSPNPLRLVFTCSKLRETERKSWNVLWRLNELRVRAILIENYITSVLIKPGNYQLELLTHCRLKKDIFQVARIQTTEELWTKPALLVTPEKWTWVQCRLASTGSAMKIITSKCVLASLNVSCHL